MCLLDKHAANCSNVKQYRVKQLHLCLTTKVYSHPGIRLHLLDASRSNAATRQRHKDSLVRMTSPHRVSFAMICHKYVWSVLASLGLWSHSRNAVSFHTSTHFQPLEPSPKLDPPERQNPPESVEHLFLSEFCHLRLSAAHAKEESCAVVTVRGTKAITCPSA